MAAPSPLFKVIFFDLGSTLIFSKDPWPPIFEHADRSLLEVFEQAGLSLKINSFSSKFESFLDSYYAERGTSPLEKTTFLALSELLEQNGYPDIPAPLVRSALDALYSVTQRNWYLETDAISTLETLREQGYPLGMISNTSDDSNVQQLIDRYKLRRFFDTIITSAGCGFRKPDKRIFLIALEYFGVHAERAVMIGDTLAADILGANQLGMYSIWISRRAQVPTDGELIIQPQAVVISLDQIPGLLTELEENAP